MAALGPFEPAPRLAVGVSGGPDSMALWTLARAWAEARGGGVVALTVDHRLRPEAAAEAEQVARWLAGAEHHVLCPATPPRPTQAAARAVRLALLEEWCARHGVLHLLLAHHREDQAETVLTRLARGSGLSGLAAMAPVRPAAHGRVLRPLLDVPAAALHATLVARRVSWLEDPSNQDPRHQRVRWRQGAALLAAEGLTSDRLADTATRLRASDDALKPSATALLRATVRHLDPLGWAALDPEPLLAAPPALAEAVLGQLLTTLGGRDHAPRRRIVARLRGALTEGRGLTGGGCCLQPAARGLWRLCREAGRIPATAAGSPGTVVLWDGRFRIVIPAGAGHGRLWALGAVAPRPPRPAGVPGVAWAALPALVAETGVFVPGATGYSTGEAFRYLPVAFGPRRPLTGG